jgi:DNA helicase HerA-like ATPase
VQEDFWQIDPVSHSLPVVALDPSVFEKLGVFYLGRSYDVAKRASSDVRVLYDSPDLVTQAACVGMTGSGKTGLCLALLEEAALDGIPAIIVDPKGDLGNLLLTFPDLRPEDFKPWVNPEEAQRKGLDVDAFAKEQAEVWRKGLAAWGERPERIRTMREKVDLAIYTPGSSSGIPVNVLASFNPPETDDPEVITERVQTTAASLLGLLKLDTDPVKSREYILLSALITHEWQNGNTLDLPALIERIQNPPFAKVGVLDLETFYPAKDRFAFVMAINSMLASPGFAAWRQGEPLDAGRFLYTAEGKPRLAIFSIAHLGDEERMFFVSLLLNEVVSWTRAQSGTTSLRAIVYMDEIFGYLPPTANPPSKLPMLTLLKQARAFGVGVVLATQNPVDLDYKALSNAGTWFIGRLQTERDKARVLDGLQGAAAGGKFDRQAMEVLLAGLGSRVFLMNNVHDDVPAVFETRWVMSYLRGPLTKDQIKALMANQKSVDRKPPTAATVAPSPDASRSAQRPAVPPSVKEVFLPTEKSGAALYLPRLLGVATVRFADSKLGVEESRETLMLAAFPEGASSVSWRELEDLSPSDLEKSPVKEAEFSDLPAVAAQPKNYAAWQKDLQQSLLARQRLQVFRCPALKTISKPGETESEFKARIALAGRENRDAAVETLRKKYAPKLAALQTRLARAEAAVAREKEQASQARMQTVISVGSTLLGALFGRKALSSSTISKATTAARGVSRSIQEGTESATAEQNAEAVREQIAAMETEVEAESAALAATEPEFDVAEVRPTRTGVTVRLVALAWVPQNQ